MPCLTKWPSAAGAPASAKSRDQAAPWTPAPRTPTRSSRPPCVHSRARMAQAEELVEHDGEAVDVAALVDAAGPRPARATCTPACRRCAPACVSNMRAVAAGSRRVPPLLAASPPRRRRARRLARARPQSITTTSPSDPIITLAGLRSRCSTALLVRVLHAAQDLVADLQAILRRVAAPGSAASPARSLAMTDSSVSPSTYFMTKK